MCLSHDNLANYFKTNFLLLRYHHYALTEIENMMPWEREVHLILLMQTLEEEKEANKKANGNYTG